MSQLKYFMTEQTFEDFAKRYPDLFQKAEIGYLGVGDGWRGILDTLCSLISSDVHQARYRLKYAMEHQGEKFADPIPVAEERLAKAIEDLPTIVEIKEKFGGLRFYVDGGNDKIDRYVVFAESMSNRVCEECGAPGKHTNGGWIKTLCKEHSKAKGYVLGSEDEDNVTAQPSNQAPKITDE
jgi:hypothetical protein